MGHPQLERCRKKNKEKVGHPPDTVTAPVKQLKEAAQTYFPVITGAMRAAPSLAKGFGNYMQVVGAFTSTPAAETAQDVAKLQAAAGGTAVAAPYVSAAAPYAITGGADLVLGYGLGVELKAGFNGQCRW